ncbi:MAG: hypothetical protein Q8O76_15365 [Chloroflexota bacterium]|nr:hypothetical protein [Chloroflexota bacterium]
MPIIRVILEGDGAWPDLKGREQEIVHLVGDEPVQIAYLSGGMKSGRPSLAIRLDLPSIEGLQDAVRRVVIAETSVRAFLAAAAAIRAKYGKEDQGGQ